MARIHQNTFSLNPKQSTLRRRLYSALVNRCSFTMLLLGLFLGSVILPLLIPNVWNDEQYVTQEPKLTATSPSVVTFTASSHHEKEKTTKNGSLRTKPHVKSPPLKEIPAADNYESGDDDETNYNRNKLSSHMDMNVHQSSSIPTLDPSQYHDDDSEEIPKNYNAPLPNTPKPTLKTPVLSAQQAYKDWLQNMDINEIQARISTDQRLSSSQSVPTTTTPYIMKTARLSDSQRMKIMVTGGAGFVGSHLVDKLMMQGHEVVVVDNFFTGQRKNIEHWMGHPNFR